MSFLQRVLVAGRVLWFYAAKLLLPIGLTFSYPRWTIDSSALWQYLYPIGVVAVAVALLLIARRTRGPLASFLIFTGALVPVLGFLNVLPFRYSWVADHFQYAASLGLIIPLAAVITTTVRRFYPSSSLGAAGVVVALLGILTLRQSAEYRDEETLYRATLARNPSSWLVHNNLGIVLEGKPGKLTEAIAEFKTVLQLNPVYGAQAHFNLADAYAKLDPPEIPEAIAEYRAGLQIEPNYVEAHTNLGTLLAGMPGHEEEAIAEFQRAVQLRPGMAQSHANLGSALVQSPGRLGEAIAEFETAVRLDPGIATLHCNLGNALLEVPGRLPDAVAQFQAALQIEPNFVEAHFLLGTALAQIPGRTADAAAEYRAALRLRPDFEPAQQALQQLTAHQ
ncbi:MAG: tetratricopeptide repeat protein [Ignavibacteriota bacterium]